MAVNPTITIGVSRLDHSGEFGRFSVNQAAQTDDLDGFLLSTEWTDFMTAVNTVCDGMNVNISYTVAKKLVNAEYASTGQREDRWTCIYQDDTTLSIYNISLPCRKNSLATVPGKDTVDLTASPWANFKTKFEALVSSPDQNPVTLLAVQLVGRNN